MYAVEVANGQGAGTGKLGVAVAAKNFHASIIVLIAEHAVNQQL
jgi:hypothetical protein